MNEQFKSKGIVLKSTPYKNSKLLTILTDNRGLISAFANGTNSTKSKLLSASEQFTYSDFVIFDYKDKLTIDSADVIESFFGIRKDLNILSLLTYLSDITLDLSPIEEDATEYLRLYLNTIDQLLKNRLPIDLIKSIYELRILSISGFMPDLTVKGKYKPDYLNGIESETVIKAMQYITIENIEKLFNFTISSEHVKVLNNITERMLKEVMEKEYPSLNFYKSIKQ